MAQLPDASRLADGSVIYIFRMRMPHSVNAWTNGQKSAHRMELTSFYTQFNYEWVVYALCARHTHSNRVNYAEDQLPNLPLPTGHSPVYALHKFRRISRSNIESFNVRSKQHQYVQQAIEIMEATNLIYAVKINAECLAKHRVHPLPVVVSQTISNFCANDIQNMPVLCVLYSKHRKRTRFNTSNYSQNHSNY